MDYDNDGVLDFLSGSYDPGDVYLFRGEGGGKYAAVEKLVDKSGLPIVHHPDELAKYQKMKDVPDADDEESIMARVASFGSWVAPVDWEADGDLDLLIGSFAGDLFVRMNCGSRNRPVYDTASVPVEADGKPLHVNMHAAPVAADWNGDGLWDLVVGSADGAVGWFMNIGAKTEPKFGPYRQLVSPASDTKFFEQNLGPEETPAHGVRAQICVTDYNRDGRLDLILGDYSDINRLRDLDADERAEFDELMDIQAKMVARSLALRKESYADRENEQLKTKLERFQKEFEKLDRKKQAFFTSSGRASFIWLFLRKPFATGGDAARADQKDGRPAGRASKPKRSHVSMKVELLPFEGADDRLRLSVALAVTAGWHIYSDVPAGSTQRTTRVQLELPPGVEAVGEWERPGGLPSPNDPKTKIYSGRATFGRTLRISGPLGGEPIRVKVHYQVCNEHYCLPPAVLQEAVAVPR